MCGFLVDAQVGIQGQAAQAVDINIVLQYSGDDPVGDTVRHEDIVLFLL